MIINYNSSLITHHLYFDRAFQFFNLMHMRISAHPLFSLFIGLIFVSHGVMGQNHTMQDGITITECDGFFLDSGGNNSGYGPNENMTMTFCPNGVDGTHVQMIFQGVDIDPADQLCFFDGPDVTAPQLSCAEDFFGGPFIVQATAVNTGGCLTITFNSDGANEGLGWNADINCIPSCQLIQAQLVSSDPPVMPVDTGWIDACPGQRIFLSGAGIYPQDGQIYNHSDFTSEFFWDFGDGNTAVGPNVSHIYDEPGGYIVQLTITDQLGCVNSNFISQRVRISTRPDFSIGGALDPEICAGDTVQLNAVVDTMISSTVVSVVGTEGSFQSGGIRSDSLPLPDGTGATYESSINITSFSPSQTLTNFQDLESIGVNMEHSWMYDLDIFLTCPDGTQIILQNQEFISDEVFLGNPYELDDISTPFPPGQGVGMNYNWVPDDSQPTWTEYAQANNPQTLPEGDYAPYESISNLEGCPLNGEWTLTVLDQWGSDNGWIFEWSINFAAHLFPNLETFTPNLVDYYWQDDPSIFFQTQDSIASAPQNAGSASYSFIVTDDFGCSYDTTVLIDVLPFTHPDCYNCSEIMTEIDDFTICEGESVDLDASSGIDLASEVTFEANPYYEFGASNHPPSNPYYSTITINSVSPSTINDPLAQMISVCVDIDSDWNSDLAIFLRAPSGEMLELSTGNGGGSDHYRNTCFTITATNPITTGTGPFTGDYMPEGDWNSLLGAQIIGDWSLIVSDALGINDMSRLVSWSISFNSINEIQYSWNPASGLSCADCPNPTASPANTTSYTIQASDSYGCTAQDEMAITVVNNIAGPAEVNCLITGDQEITFSWTQVGSFVEYEVNQIINGASQGWEGPVAGASFVVGNLGINDEVELEVRVYTGGMPISCEVSVTSGSCIYDLCGLQAVLGGPPTPVSCFGGNDGMVSIIANNANGPFSYYLDGSTSSQNNGNFTNLSAGNHFVIVEDADMCFDTIPFQVTEPDILSVTIGIDQEVSCFEGSDGILTAEVLGGNGNNNYSWNLSPINNATIEDLASGEYGLTVTDQKGCMAETLITLNNPDSISLSLSSINTSCSSTLDGEVAAMASGGTGTLTYQWSNNVDGTSTQDNLGVGQYCVTVTDQNNCAKVACTDIIAPDALVVDSIVATPVACFGGDSGSATVFASGGSGTYSFLWDDNLAQLSQTAIVLSSQNYNVSVTDANGCEVVANIFIPEPELLQVAIEVTPALCKGEASGSATAIPAGGVGPFQFQWSNQQQEADAVDLLAGNYFLTLTDANGCQLIQNFAVGEPENEVSVILNQTRQGCFGTQGNEVTAVPSGGTGSNFTYEWSDPLGQQTATATGLDSSSYSVTVMDENGCSTTGALKLNDLEPIVGEISIRDPSCFGYLDGGVGVVAFSGGIGVEDNEDDYTFVWNNGRVGVGINDLLGGQTYTVTITDQQGCQGVVERFLPQPAEITFELEKNDVSCFAGSDGAATVVNVQGDVGGFVYQWGTNAGSETTASVDGLATGTYFVTVMDADGCEVFQSVAIEQPTEIEIAFETIDNICFGDAKGRIISSVEGGTGAYTYNWSNQRTLPNIENLLAGEYILTITDANGCEMEGITEIFQPDALEVNIKTEDITCFGGRDGRVTLTPQGGTPPYRYSLDNSNFNGAGTKVGLTAGEYNVFVKDANECMFVDKTTVIEPPEFRVDAGAGEDIREINLGDSTWIYATPINAAGDVTYVWSAPYEGTLGCSECPGTISKPEYTITYELYGIDANGCEATDLLTIVVNKTRVALVPTGFSPNDDTKNDRLIVHGHQGTMVKSFRVFDRWGEMLFEDFDFGVNEKSRGWDGTFRGEPVNAGVYVWSLTVEYIDGVEETLSGHTTLIR